MAKSTVHLPVVGLGNTLRKDTWWVLPLTTFVVFTSFIAYATFRAFENAHYEFGPYLSPFYSPFFETRNLPGVLRLVTPAMLILPGPASFRFTCYYYRKAYYRAFAMDPPACAVGEHRGHSYNGETKLLLFQNLHRYTLYVALIFILILWYDAFKSLFWGQGPHGPEAGTEFHVGLGSVIMFVNVIFISLYTLSCHALRHLVGGGVNSFSTAPLGQLRYTIWKGVSKINTRHATWAWISLITVALTDFYVRMVASGAITDLRII